MPVVFFAKNQLLTTPHHTYVLIPYSLTPRYNLKRYPVCGNSTIRTVDQTDITVEGPDGLGGIHEYKVPVGTPVSIHIWSLQNSLRQWEEPDKFMPSRWLSKEENGGPLAIDSVDDAQNKSDEIKKPSHPRCPFSKKFMKSVSIHIKLFSFVNSNK